MAGACPLWAGVLSRSALSVPFVFTKCLPSVHLLFAATFKANSNSKRQARYRRLHVASQRVPLCNPATLRVDADALRLSALDLAELQNKSQLR